MRNAYAYLAGGQAGGSVDETGRSMNARPRPPELSRRHLLAAGGALIVSFSLSGHSEADETGATPSPAKEAALPGSLAKTPVLDAWIRVDGDEGSQRSPVRRSSARGCGLR